MTPHEVLARRRAEQQALLDQARDFSTRLDAALGVRAVVVVGSVARGDFNVWSDIDVLVVATGVPPRVLDRYDRLPTLPPRVQPIVWTPEEWEARRAAGDPVAFDAVDHGVWLVGTPEMVTPG